MGQKLRQLQEMQLWQSISTELKLFALLSCPHSAIGDADAGYLVQKVIYQLVHDE
jgi:hypothetical protein